MDTYAVKISTWEVSAGQQAALHSGSIKRQILNPESVWVHFNFSKCKEVNISLFLLSGSEIGIGKMMKCFSLGWCEISLVNPRCLSTHFLVKSVTTIPFGVCFGAWNVAEITLAGLLVAKPVFTLCFSIGNIWKLIPLIGFLDAQAPRLWFYKAVVPLFWHKRFSSTALLRVLLYCSILSQVQGLVSTFSFSYSSWDNFDSRFCYLYLNLILSMQCPWFVCFCPLFTPMSGKFLLFGFPCLTDLSLTASVLTLALPNRAQLAFCCCFSAEPAQFALLTLFYPNVIVEEVCLSLLIQLPPFSGCRGGQNELKRLESLSSNRRVGF